MAWMGTLTYNGIEEPAEEPLSLPGLLPDLRHDPLLKKWRRFHLFQALQQFLHLHEIQQRLTAMRAGRQMPGNVILICRGNEILQIGGKPFFNLMARHFISPNTLDRQSFRAALARKSRDLTVPSGSFRAATISS